MSKNVDLLFCSLSGKMDLFLFHRFLTSSAAADSVRSDKGTMNLRMRAQ